MKPLRLYLDTSVLSHLFHDDTPERKADTVELFDKAIGIGVYENFISSIVIDELRRTGATQQHGRLAHERPSRHIAMFYEQVGSLFA